tara:strand:- start:271 stop:411 length:141 start_codon:yes stop_codon:yes gene_type:complete
MKKTTKLNSKPKTIPTVKKRGKKPVFYENIGFFKRKWELKAKEENK